MSDEQHEQRLNIMKLKILKLERDNLKSQNSNSAMVDKIYEIIKNEAQKIYGGTRHED